MEKTCRPYPFLLPGRNNPSVLFSSLSKSKAVNVELKKPLPEQALKESVTFVGFVGELPNQFMKDLEAIVNTIEELRILENDKSVTPI